jgi:PAS domain S-box-containing protein
MAPSTALLFLLLGVAVCVHARTPDRRAIRRGVIAAGAFGTAMSLGLLVLSLSGVHLQAEHLGIPISGRLGGVPLGHMSPLTAFCFVLAGVSLLSLPASSRCRARRAAVAFAPAFLLVLMSTILTVAYLLGGPLIYGSGVIPPALSTSLAFLALGTALLLASGERAWSGDLPSRVIAARSTVGLFLIFAVAATGIVSAGYLYSRGFQKRFRAEAEAALTAVAELKVGQLARWREERLGDAILLFENERFSARIRRILDDPQDSDARRGLQTWLDRIRAAHDYVRVSILDGHAVERASAPDTPEPVASYLAQGAAEALRTGQIAFLDFHREAADRPIRLAVVVPILDTVEPGRALGVLALHIDPEEFVYPLLRRWPTPAATTESILIRRDGHHVLFLNDLRFRENSALGRRIPREQADLLTAMALRGQESVREGVDYRGVRSVAALRAVPDSPWFLIARMDASELYAPARAQLWTLVGLVGVLLVGAAAGVGVLWRDQANRFYRERYQAAKALARSEETLRTVFESARDGILAADAATNGFVIANEAICRMVGYTREELLTLDVTDLHPAEHLPNVLEQYDRQRRGEIVLASDLPVLCKDGSVFFADVNSTPVVLNGRSCVIGVFRDITDRMRAEARIGHLNAVLRGIRNVNQLITRVKDPHRLIQEACAMLVDVRGFYSTVVGRTDARGQGIASHASAGRRLPALQDALERGELPDCARRAIATRQIVVLSDPDEPGSAPRPGAASLDGETDALVIALTQNGRTYGFLLACLAREMATDQEEQDLLREVAGDIAFALRGMEIETERDESTAALADTEAQLRQAQKLEAIGQLAGGVAHDFNNILMAQMGYCELMKRGLKDEDPLAQDLAQILACADRAAALTRQLLAFSRKQTLQPEVLDLNAVVANIEKMLRRLIGEDIDLATVLAADLGMVMADPGQVEQVIMNLAVNARDAMPQGGRLSIETANVELDEVHARNHLDATPGRHVMLAIADTGCGMDEKTRSRLFEPFFTTKGIGRGTGLGLATVYGIVKQSGGNIWVYTEPGKGTTFKVYFPCVDAQPTPRVATEATVANGNGELLLVVEDEAALRTLFARMIRELGYRVRVAANGGEALLAVEEEGLKPDLLITDVVMPGMSGRVLAERLQRILPGLPVLYASGYTDNAIVHHGVLDPGTPFLQKPFGIGALGAKIRQLLAPRDAQVLAATAGVGP